MERSVENKIVVVTGGAAGIGLEMVSKFIEKGAKVTIIIDVDEEQGTNAIKILNEKYGDDKADFMKCDVTSDLDLTFEKILNVYQAVDVLVNNAGVLDDISIRRTMEINTIALMEWTAKFYDYMRKDKAGNGGTIINVSSIYGFRIMAYNPYYQASKFAVIGFSKSMGHDYNYKKTGVRVIVLCPGLTHTKLAGVPTARDKDSISDLVTELNATEWQEVEAIGKGILEIFAQADSGSVWLVEGSRSAVMVS